MRLRSLLAEWAATLRNHVCDVLATRADPQVIGIAAVTDIARVANIHLGWDSALDDGPDDAVNGPAAIAIAHLPVAADMEVAIGRLRGGLNESLPQPAAGDGINLHALLDALQNLRVIAGVTRPQHRCLPCVGIHDCANPWVTGSATASRPAFVMR